jgi:hypothetical protein
MRKKTVLRMKIRQKQHDLLDVTRQSRLAKKLCGPRLSLAETGCCCCWKGCGALGVSG